MREPTACYPIALSGACHCDKRLDWGIETPFRGRVAAGLMAPSRIPRIPPNRPFILRLALFVVPRSPVRAAAHTMPT